MKEQIRIRNKRDPRKTPGAIISAVLILAVFFVGSALVIKETYSNIRFTKAIWTSHLPNVRYYIYEDFLENEDLEGIDYYSILVKLGSPDITNEYEGEDGCLYMEYIYNLGHGKGEKDELSLIFYIKNYILSYYDVVGSNTIEKMS